MRELVSCRSIHAAQERESENQMRGGESPSQQLTEIPEPGTKTGSQQAQNLKSCMGETITRLCRALASH